ncbi:MAG: hypothetical protein AVDCRST_MAG76-476 [uncultured Acidimicrobiales bacterium]|uniref:DUF222 domain-containing protein n=1 Tax=uncultured Acidimicrobiales bacterium TaxID=310071 RepID=A0A6J4H9G6_9ACTN|nr:MAG: hypothetical protein AVDCRST_MAG76-476 [uncultured Acidimicrobiales bacterium]
MCSTVTTALEEVLGALGGADEEILALVDMRDRVEAALVERVGVFDATEGWAADGAYSFPCWLRARADVSRGESLQLGRFARTLRSMPATEAAVEAGKLSVAKARLLAGVINERTRARFDDQEAFLVDQVQGLDVDGAAVALRYWKRLADTDGPDPADPTRNRASMTKGWDDRWHLDADLDPVSGAVVSAVLDAIAEKMHQDGRFSGRDEIPSRARRTAESLVEMATRASGPHPDQPAVHPDIVVVVPVERLTENQPDPFAPPAELVGTGPVALDDVLRLSLLGTVSTMAIDGDGRPLNLGRKQRLATPDQWIALNVRDRGCVAPGCDRPAGFCQAHHLAWWDRDLGATDLANLCLVCSHHHHLIHDQGWTLQPRTDGTWNLTRPDHSTVDPPRYPRSQSPRPTARAPD